jgi:4-hydroxy-tetrahydrodipicolinate synthase
MDRFPDGVWPVMLTPFTDDNEIDFPSLKRLIDFYIDNGVTGLFAVCQSSEIFFLSLEERAALSQTVVEYAAGRVAVISGGQTAINLDKQTEEIQTIASTGATAVVLLTNQFATEKEDDKTWWKNFSQLLKNIPKDITLGLYECPYPYKRVASPELLRKCAGTGRVVLMKDTCCDAALIRAKLAMLAGTDFKLFNANTATLLDSLQAGANGYSGVMANFHPDLYVWLCDNFTRFPKEASLLEGFLTMSSYIEKQYYPVNAKYALSQLGIMGVNTRAKDPVGMTETFRLEVSQLMEISAEISHQLKQISLGG